VRRSVAQIVRVCIAPLPVGRPLNLTPWPADDTNAGKHGLLTRTRLFCGLGVDQCGSLRVESATG